MELIIGEHLPAHEKATTPFDEAKPALAKMNLAEMIKQERIQYTTTRGSVSFWLADRCANPVKVFGIIADFIAESEGGRLPT